MFEKVHMAPADAILGLLEAFNKDSNPRKINLAVGVYKDAKGNTPIFNSVKRAEEKILQTETTKTYVGISGAPNYTTAVQRLLFGANHEVITSKRIATAQTPGGTGALRVAADFLKKLLPASQLWLSEPTWDNHGNIFKAAGHTIQVYPYYDPQRRCLAFDEMMEAFNNISKEDIVLLHGCCHNPTGMDPNPEQWNAIGAVAAQRGFIPLVDLAYQGLADGLEEDVVGVGTLCNHVDELIVAASFSKNFGLYCERTGYVTLLGATEQTVQNAFSHVKACIRSNYSNPPSHGASIVSTILNDPELESMWRTEVCDMRNRINNLRKLFVETLKGKGLCKDFSFIINQRGMFSLLGLTPEHVKKLRANYSIYIVNSGRINVAGLSENNMDYVCQAIAEVIQES